MSDSGIIIPGEIEVPMNRRKKELIDNYIQQKQAYDELVKREALNDLFIYNKYVLNVEGGKQKLAPVHKELCHFITDDMKRKKLLMLPRGHLKSSLVTIGYSTWRINKDQNVRGLILNATWQMAVDFLTEIKRHLRENPTLLDLYGDVTVDAPEWSADRITLKRTDQNIKGPTLWATGIDSNLVGSHPDFIIMDDVVNRDNINTREGMEKVILRYKDALDLLEPGGALIVVGTVWSDGDLYSWIQDKDRGISQSYDIMVKRAYTGSIETGNDFQALWPEKFSRKELQGRLREKGWYEFSCQYLNEAVPSEDADFKKEWFHYYDREEYRGKEMRTIACIDPAISLEKDADFTAMGVVGVDKFTNIFIKDLVKKRMKPSDIIDYIFYLDELWHPQMWLIETIAYQKALAYALRDEMQKRHKFLPLYEIKQHDKSKDQRIRGLQPLYMNGKIFHPKNHTVVPYLEEELTRFPRSRHDDLADMLSMCLDYLTPPRAKEKRYKHNYLY